MNLGSLPYLNSLLRIEGAFAIVCLLVFLHKVIHKHNVARDNHIEGYLLSLFNIIKSDLSQIYRKAVYFLFGNSYRLINIVFVIMVLIVAVLFEASINTIFSNRFISRLSVLLITIVWILLYAILGSLVIEKWRSKKVGRLLILTIVVCIFIILDVLIWQKPYFKLYLFPILFFITIYLTAIIIGISFLKRILKNALDIFHEKKVAPHSALMISLLLIIEIGLLLFHYPGIPQWQSGLILLLILLLLYPIGRGLLTTLLIPELIYFPAKERRPDTGILLRAASAILVLAIWEIIMILFFSLLACILANFDPTAYFSQSRLELLYHIVITFTSVGYGDIVPQSPLAKILSMITAFVGHTFSIGIAGVLVVIFLGGMRKSTP